MSETGQTPSRKAEHVALCVRENVEHRGKRAGFDDLEFEHNALPELAFAEIELDTTLLGHSLAAPLIISSMTGGYAGALEINRGLARLAHTFGLAMGVGSERQALEDTLHHETFRIVRREAPTEFLFANIGASEVARLAKSRKISELKRATDLIEANALAIHLNPLQELLQPEGSPDFRGVLCGVEQCVRELGLPVIVKEVGSGISGAVAKKLVGAGVSVIDVAGSGGTSWAGVEILRNSEAEQDRFTPFWDWGISTVESLLAVTAAIEERSFEIIASGGVRNGLDIAKSIALGATAAGMARPLIKILVDRGEEALHDLVQTLLYQLRAVMFLTGSRTVSELARQKLYSR